ncbi:MAG: hypothetical protein CMN76_00960 [Spirochaetaceae bacterium]|nr:hypothetical protein [Spirochaetaceae bacterium]
MREEKAQPACFQGNLSSDSDKNGGDLTAILAALAVPAEATNGASPANDAPKRMFVTMSTSTGAISISGNTGIQGADYYCNNDSNTGLPWHECGLDYPGGLYMRQLGHGFRHLCHGRRFPNQPAVPVSCRCKSL